MDTFLVCVPMCLVAAFELIYCVWGRPLLRNICVSFSTVSTVILCPSFIYERVILISHFVYNKAVGYVCLCTAVKLNTMFISPCFR